ncbi:MAG: hypothetical protein H6603_11190 [Flavobacteriales bacterium]|nr:hypothetical protein [Flavobacteriales bacterium]
MATVGNIRNALINKIMAINDKEVLAALDKLISLKDDNEEVELTEEQRILLEMSEDDIANGRMVAEKDLFYQQREWLKKQ